MAYEYQYESGIKNIIHRHNLWVSDTDYKNAKESLNEIYRKAKVFDEISIILDEYLGDVEDELNALNLIREKLEGMEDE